MEMVKMALLMVTLPISVFAVGIAGYDTSSCGTKVINLCRAVNATRSSCCSAFRDVYSTDRWCVCQAFGPYDYNSTGTIWKECGINTDGCSAGEKVGQGTGASSKNIWEGKTAMLFTTIFLGYVLI